MEKKNPEGRPRTTIERLVETGRWKEDWKETIYQLGREGKTKTFIMEEMGMARTTFYKLMDREPEFRNAVKKAETYAQNFWIELARTEWVKGNSRSINSNHWSLLMRNMFNEDWSESQKLDLTSNGKQINNNTISVEIIKSQIQQDEDTHSE